MDCPRNLKHLMLFGLTEQIKGEILTQLGKVEGNWLLNAPLQLTSSIARNAGRIARVNVTDFKKVTALAQAFYASDASIVFMLPGFLKIFLPRPIETHLKVGSKSLKIWARGGGSICGLAFMGNGKLVQLFHLDPVLPSAPTHFHDYGGGIGNNGRDIDAWVDPELPFLNYQVPKA
jgi:hypothetical protein